MDHPIPGTTPQLGTPKSPWIQKPNWPDWKNTPITLWLFWHLPTEVMESKVRFTQPLLNKMYPDLPLLWKPWPCLKIRFWFVVFFAILANFGIFWLFLSWLQVSWKTPEEPNGIILQYTVYMKELARSRDVAPRSHKVNALQMSHQVDNLNANAR